jgi:hypothetical protein
MSVPIITSYIQQKYTNFNFPIPFLTLSGPKISQIVFYKKRECSSYATVYLDNIGIPDIGFKRGTFVTLNDAEVEKLIEFILTCKWT